MSCGVLAFAPAFAEIAIKEFDAEFFAELFHEFGDVTVFLIDRVEKSGADGVETVFFSIFKGLAEAEWIAIGLTALCEVAHGVFVDVANKIIKAVFVFDDEADID